MPTRVRLHRATILLCAAAGAAAQEKGDPAKKEAELLQDTWNFVSVEQAGVKQPRRKRGEEFQTVTFRGDKFKVKRGDTVLQAGTHTFDPGKDPKTFDLTVSDGEGKGTVRPGIYEMSGDTLKVCFDPRGKQRPAAFESTAESGYTLAVLQRERGAGADPRDASVVYDPPKQMNSGFKAYNGKAYDVTALRVGPGAKVVVPDEAAVVGRHDQAGVLLVCMEKRAHIGAHFNHAVSVADYRKKMGCAVKLEKGELLVGTFGEFGFFEGSVTMRLLVLVPPKVEVVQRAGLNGRYGGRAGSERDPKAINPGRDDPKPALTKSEDGTPPRWLPPAVEDGWHEVPAVADAERRAGKAEAKKD
jgi:uncharacterized protein (TIGR03067 family)